MVKLCSKLKMNTFLQVRKDLFRTLHSKNVQVSATFLLIKSNVLAQYSNTKNFLGYFEKPVEKFSMKELITRLIDYCCLYIFRGFVIYCFIHLKMQSHLTKSADLSNTSITFERRSKRCLKKTWKTFLWKFWNWYSSHFHLWKIFKTAIVPAQNGGKQFQTFSKIKTVSTYFEE